MSKPATKPGPKSPRNKYIVMIIIGFGGPAVLLIICIFLFAIANYLLAMAGGGTDLVASIVNSLLLLLGLVAVTGIVWGPILGVVGIIKLSNLPKKPRKK